MENRKKWLVTMSPIAGLRGPAKKILIVQAICERTARLSAWNQSRKGAYKHRAMNMWKIEIREAKDE